MAKQGGGLANLGNTCGINTLIQCIAHTPALYKAVMETQGRAQPRKGKALAITPELGDILEGIHAKGHTISPGRFVNAFYKVMGGLAMPGEQTDINELWGLMADLINDEVGVKRTVSWSDGDGGGGGGAGGGGGGGGEGIVQELMARGDAEWAKQTAGTVGPWLDASHGMLVNQVHCKNCEKIYHNFEPFTTLTLPLPPDGRVALKDCIAAFFAEERLDGWKCDCCQSSVDGWKVARIWVMPVVLVMALKRFETDGNGRSRKTNTLVVDIEEINMNEWTIKHTGNKVRFGLQAVGNHHGVYGGGHYVAIGRVAGVRDGANWVMYDDLDRVKMKPGFLESPFNYMLFFQ